MATVPSSTRAWLHRLLLAVVLVFAAFLRFDAHFQMYGQGTGPVWLDAIGAVVTPARDWLLPDGWTWPRVAQPYVGGDPMGYLKYAREMTHFYAGHIREPVFVATTRLYLVLTGNRDCAVGLASLTYSMLYVLAAYLLGRAVASRWVGLAVGLAIAVERDFVAWAPEGWRDEAFGAWLLLVTWSVARFAQRASWPRAAVAGIVGAAACLTRITSVTFVVPGLLWVAWSHRHAWRTAAPRVLLAAGVTLVLVSPYLINCWRVTGDPFVAINVHTRFYQFAENHTTDPSQTAADYAIQKFTTRPVRTLDTAARGLLIHPFAMRWHGYELWLPRLGLVLQGLAALGLVAWLFVPIGRFLLLMLLTSLVPYMLTWSLPGGGEWRFTMHAYGFYLLAAAMLVRRVAIAGRSFVASPAAWMAAGGRLRRLAAQTATVIVIASAGLTARFWAPLLIAKESLIGGESTSIQAAPDDRVFFQRGWTGLVTSGVVVSRFARESRAVLLLPLPERRPYHLLLRIDALPHVDPPPRLRLFLRGRPLGVFDLTWSPERVGAIAIDIPADAAGGSRVPLELVSESLFPLGDAHQIYPDLPPSSSVAFRLWYARLTPE